jgi:cytochrome c
LFEGKGMLYLSQRRFQNYRSKTEIAKIYTDKVHSIFLQGEADPIVDPTQYEIMKISQLQKNND